MEKLWKETVIHTTIILEKTSLVGIAHIYELRKNGKVIYKFNNEIQDDGSEIQSGVDHFYEKAEKIMDAGVDESISRPI